MGKSALFTEENDNKLGLTMNVLTTSSRTELTFPRLQLKFQELSVVYANPGVPYILRSSARHSIRGNIIISGGTRPEYDILS